MARDYQRHWRNQYHLPEDIYKQTLWIIRGYKRLVKETNEILYESPNPSDGMPHGTNTSNPVEAKMIRRAADLERIKKIEKAKDAIPPEYMEGIWNSLIEGERYPEDADKGSYGHWKSAYVYRVAELFELI